MFGALCLTVGIIGGVFDNLVTGPARIRDLALSGESLVASTAGGGLVRYDSFTNRWIDVFESDALSGDRALPPVAIQGGDFLVAQVRGGRFNPFGSGSLDLLLLSSSNDWEPVPSLRLPTGTVWMDRVAPERLLAMNAGGLALTTIDEVRQAAGEVVNVDKDAIQSTSPRETADPVPDWIAKLAGMMGGATSGFQEILPREVTLASPRRVAVSADGTAIIVASAGRLFRLSPSSVAPAVSWKLDAQIELDGDSTQSVVLACDARHVLVARAKEPLRIFDAMSLELRATIDTDDGFIPVHAIALGEQNAFAIVDGQAKCRIVRESASARGVAWDLSDAQGPGEVETVEFDVDTGHLVVVHHVDQIDELPMELGGSGSLVGASVRSIRPSLSK